MFQKLQNIASIQTGLYATPEPSGEVLYLQAKDINANGHITDMVSPNLAFKPSMSRHLLENGDILLMAKGIKNPAVVYKADISKAVASSTFIRLRVRSSEILPQYLSWYLNCPIGQQYIKASAMGTSIQSVSISGLENMEVSIPTMQVQEQIIKIHTLRQQVRIIMEKLEALRDIEIQHTLIQASKR